jgi:hypothetical protein
MSHVKVELGKKIEMLGKTGFFPVDTDVRRCQCILVRDRPDTDATRRDDNETTVGIGLHNKPSAFESIDASLDAEFSRSDQDNAM